MDELQKTLEQLEKNLLQIISEAESVTDLQAVGTIRVSTRNGKPSFYWVRTKKYLNKEQNLICRENDETTTSYNGEYISINDQETIRLLIQKDYNHSVLKLANMELRALQKFIKVYEPNLIRNLYDKSHPARQSYITPVIPTDQTFLEEWNDQLCYFPASFTDSQKQKLLRKRTPENTYEKKGTLFTKQGEQMRSKSELIIMERLKARGIPVKYECAVYLEGLGWRFPDFTVLNVRTRKTYFWEHLGMMGDRKYAEENIDKIEGYQMNGFWQGDQLLLTMEYGGNSINTKIVDDIIDKYLI